MGDWVWKKKLVIGSKDIFKEAWICGEERMEARSVFQWECKKQVWRVEDVKVPPHLDGWMQYLKMGKASVHLNKKKIVYFDHTIRKLLQKSKSSNRINTSDRSCMT